MCQDCEELRQRLEAAEQEIKRLQSILVLADALRNRQLMEGVGYERSDGAEPVR